MICWAILHRRIKGIISNARSRLDRSLTGERDIATAISLRLMTWGIARLERAWVDGGLARTKRK